MNVVYFKILLYKIHYICNWIEEEKKIDEDEDEYEEEDGKYRSLIITYIYI
jgi:hypothetical protein